jgi:hypothetical protein
LNWAPFPLSTSETTSVLIEELKATPTISIRPALFLSALVRVISAF